MKDQRGGRVFQKMREVEGNHGNARECVCENWMQCLWTFYLVLVAETIVENMHEWPFLIQQNTLRMDAQAGK